MADTLTPEQRKRCMSHIRGKDTKPEVKLRKALWAAGLRGYRLHNKKNGNADIAFIAKQVAIFVDGCFWHGCPIHGQDPKTNSEFWKKKIKRNQERDRQVSESLLQQGWCVIRIWEHEIKADLAGVVTRVEQRVKD